MKRLLITVAVTALAIPLGLQAQEGGIQADGWEGRLDRDGDINGVLHFRTMGEGLHASTAGRGAGIFWRETDTHSGNYSISATFTQTEPSSHPNAYGLFFGGADLSGPDQRYSYFVIRENGQYLLRQRAGSETPDVIAWTSHDAIKALDADGRSTNTLTVEVGSSQVRFLVNDMEVTSQPRSSFDTDGLAGLRVNHQLDVHIANANLGM
jgi:hypothetical protein